MYEALLPSPIGPLYVEADEHGLTKLYTDGHHLHTDAGPDDGTFAEVQRQLDEYFAGERTEFDLALSEHGTPFERSVWARLREIPHGETVTYGELNALAALAAAGVFLAADTHVSTTVAMAIGLLVGFFLRAAAIRFGLRGPAPRTSRRGDP